MNRDWFKEKLEFLSRDYGDMIKKGTINQTSQEDIKSKIVIPFINVMMECDFRNHELEEEFSILKAKFHGGKDTSVDFSLINKETGESSAYIEVKRSRTGKKLQKNALFYSSNHLYRLNDYFNLSQNRVLYILLTNGEEYWFYADFDKSKNIDNNAFFKFNILDYTEEDLSNLYYILNCKFNRKELKKMFYRTIFYQNNIRHYRLKKGLTQKQLGEALGVSEQWIGALERSEHDPTITTAVKLSKMLGISISELFAA